MPEKEYQNNLNEDDKPLAIARAFAVVEEYKLRPDHDKGYAAWLKKNLPSFAMALRSHIKGKPPEYSELLSYVDKGQEHIELSYKKIKQEARSRKNKKLTLDDLLNKKTSFVNIYNEKGREEALNHIYECCHEEEVGPLEFAEITEVLSGASAALVFDQMIKEGDKSALLSFISNTIDDVNLETNRRYYEALAFGLQALLRVECDDVAKLSEVLGKIYDFDPERLIHKGIFTTELAAENSAIIPFMIAKGVPRHYFDNGWLVKMCEAGRLDMVKILLPEKRNLSRSLGSAMEAALSSDHVAVAEYLFTRGASLKNSFDKVMLECLDNNAQNSLLWLCEGVSDFPINRAVYLEKALRYKNYEVADILTNQGRNINLGQTVKLYSGVVARGDHETLDYLKKHGYDPKDELEHAANNAISQGQDVKMLERVVAEGLDLNASGNKLMETALKIGRLDVLDYFQDKGLFEKIGEHHLLSTALAHRNGDSIVYLFNKNMRFKTLDTTAMEHNSFGFLSEDDINFIDLCVEKHDGPIIGLESLTKMAIFSDSRSREHYASDGRIFVKLLSVYEKIGVDKQRHIGEMLDDIKQGHLSYKNIVPALLYMLQQDWPITENDLNQLAKLDCLEDSAAYELLYQASEKNIIDIKSYLDPNSKQCMSEPELFENFKLWRKYLPYNEMDESIYKYSPKRLKPDFFMRLNSYVMDHVTTKGASLLAAYKWSTVFANEDQLVRYLNKWHEDYSDPDSALRDHGRVFELPEGHDYDAKAWQDAIMQHGRKMLRLIKYANHIKKPARSADGKKWSYNKTLLSTAPYYYMRAKENIALAQICIHLNVKEKTFSDVLDVTNEYLKQYKNRMGKASYCLPNYMIDGRDFGKPGYLFYRMQDGDPRGLLLGEFTDCCQSIHGAADSCARHGFLDKNSGFYVVADKATDKIVAQTWAWRGHKGELVFDSLEALSGHMKAEQWESLTCEFAKQAEKDSAADITSINIGAGGETPVLSFDVLSKAKMAKLKGYQGSSDAKNKQFIVGKITCAA